MPIQPTLESVGHLFGANLIFRVPMYQRYYAWEADQITDFLNDLSRCVEARIAGGRREHFFGGLVTVRATVADSNRQNMEIIDGQQRIASYTMLATQLRYAALKLADAVDTAAPDCPRDFLLQFAETLKAKFERFRDKVKLQVVEIDRLELSKPDREYFKELLDNRTPATKRASHRLLKQAWERIGARLEELVASRATDAEKASVLSMVETVMETDWIVILMVTNDKSEAYRLFQVLNDRGTGLTEGELCRAQVLEAIDGIATGQQMVLVEETWDAILDEKSDIVEGRLRTLYSSQTGKRAGKATLLDDLMGAFFPEIKKALGPHAVKEIVDTVERIKEELRLLIKLQDGEWPYEASNAVTAWDRGRLVLLINELKHTNCLPLLLAAAKLPESDFSDVVQMLERFMFRYKIVADAHIGPATKVYHDHAVAIRGAVTSYKVAKLRADLQVLLERSAGDAVFRPRLAGMAYSRDLTNKPLRYLFITLEAYHRWFADGAVGLPRCMDKMQPFDPAATTVEHVYPAKANPQSPDLEPLINALGNLTLLGSTDNDAAGNKPFAFKKSIFEKSNLRLNREIASEADWTVEVVERRRERLLDMAGKIFKLA